MNRAPMVVCVLLAASLVVVTWLWMDARSSLARERSQAEVANVVGDVRRAVAAKPAGFADTPAATASAEARAATRPARVPPGTLIADTATGWSAGDPIGLLLFGRVGDEQGNPIDGASVALQSEDIEYRNGTVVKTGSYVVPDLHPGVWRVTARGEACAPFETEITLASSPTRMRYDIVLRPATIIPVKFQTRDGKPLAGVIKQVLPSLEWRAALIAVATVGDPGPHLPRTENRGHEMHALGVWREGSRGPASKMPIPDGCDGFLEVWREPPFLVSAVLRDEVLATKRVTSSKDEVVFMLDLADFQRALAGARLRVVDALTGAPVAGARVGLHDRQSSGGGVTTGADGVALFENHVGGLAVLEVAVPKYEHFEQYARLPCGEVTDLGDVRIAPSTTISGRLLSPDGTPVGGNMRFYNLDRMTFAHALSFGWSSAQVERDGRFKIQGVGRGRYLLMGGGDPYAITTTIVDTAGGDVADVDVRLRAGIRVILDVPESAVERLMQIKDAAGVLQYGGRYPRAGCLALQLAAGSYVLTVFDDEAPMLTKPFDVGTSPIRVRVAP